MLSAICPVQWKPGFIHEENTSPKCQTPLNVSICPFKSVTMNCSVMSRPRWGRQECRWASLRQFLTVCAEILWLTDCCSNCPGGWSKMILEVKMLDVEVLDWCGYTWSVVVRPVGCTAKFSETPLEMAYGRDMNLQFTGNNSGGHSCMQSACQLHVPSKLATSVALCCVIKLHIFEWPFIVDTCAIIMLSNQHFDMPHLWGGWIILAN